MKTSNCAPRNCHMIGPLILLLAGATLSACGGGGGGNSGTVAPTSTAPATVNVYAAYANLARQPHNFALSGSNSQGTNLTATLNVAQAGQVTWSGTLFDTAQVTLSVYRNGALAASGVSTAWQDAGTPYWAITFQSADGTCTLRSGGTALPTSAALGSSGAFFTGTQYAGCNSGNLPQSFWVSTGTVTTTWTYSSINGMGFACFNSSDAGFVGTSTESDCVEVLDAAGTLGTHARITVKDLNGVTTTLAN